MLTLTVALLILPASATAATLPETSTPGVGVTKHSGGRLTIRFALSTAGRRAYKPLAGKTVQLRCQRVDPAAPVGTGPQGVATTPVKLAKAVSTIRLRLRGNGNFCSLGSVALALTTPARRFLADFEAYSGVLAGVALATDGSATSALRRLKSKGQRLTGAGAMPRRNRIGIFSQGDHLVVAVRSASGRRIFTESQGDTERTNAAALFSQIEQTPLPRGAQLPSGARPPAGTPLPATTDPEVTATRDGRTVSVDFTGSARQQLGRRVPWECTRPAPKDEGFFFSGGSGSDEPAPDPGKPLTFRMPGDLHLCGVRFGTRVARVALDDTGRAQLDESLVGAGLERVLRAAAADAAPGYPAGEALSAQYEGAVAPLASASDTPGDLRIGAWSDGARKLVLTAIARTGKRLFAQVDGDVLTTNANVAPLPNP